MTRRAKQRASKTTARRFRPVGRSSRSSPVIRWCSRRSASPQLASCNRDLVDVRFLPPRPNIWPLGVPGLSGPQSGIEPGEVVER